MRRDSGNLDLAKEKAEELIKIAPKDDNVQRLLGAINKDLDRRSGKVTSAGYGQANSQDVELAMELSLTGILRPLQTLLPRRTPYRGGSCYGRSRC